MKPGARLKAAVEVLDDVLTRHRPASTALADWGKAHRFAGSGDRSAIGSLVYDALRQKQSIAARMGADTTRALVLGAALTAFGMTPEDVAAACDGSQHALPPLSEGEKQALAQPLPAVLPAHVAGDFPEWLAPSLTRAFGDRAAVEAAALAQRAPIDLRVNTLKTTREQALAALAPLGAVATPLSPIGLRIPPPEGRARAPHVEAEPAHGLGQIEVQDEGSQIAALLAGAEPETQVLDLCAGAGGKTLALAASMNNTGKLFAYDADKLQLRPIFERLKRADVTNVEVLAAGREEPLLALGASFDLVLADAPCTGSGTWRRRPDAKWKLKPKQLADRQQDQRKVLETAARLVKPGGRLVYVTCSILPEENTGSVSAFLASHPGFALLPYAEVWAKRIGTAPPRSADGRDDGLLLSPASHGTDGFYVAILARRA
jgi:16S rRNA (cytosine967-C5)-methyltransferase